jgi:hypothetical protein
MTLETVDSVNNPEALFDEGKKYFFSGRDSATDPSLALAYFEKAARLGYAPAQRLLGISLLNGEVTPKNVPAALKWLEMAAAQDDPQAAFELAKISAKGQDAPKDWKRAYRLLSDPRVMALPEAKALTIRLKGELWRLYPNLLAALKKEDAFARSQLPPRFHRFVPPFTAPGRPELDAAEFDVLLALNLGQSTPENALMALKQCLTQYYEIILAANPL